MKKHFYFILTLLVLIAFNSTTYANDFVNKRALWVTRWDYRSPADIKKIMENAKDIGSNHVLFQIRGNATTFYRSEIEPWAWELTGGGAHNTGKDPGWDPLQVAIEEAHKNNLELHGWINVFPGWRGESDPPAGVKHPWRDHRDWFIVDHNGNMLDATSGFYSFLSPGHPEVRAYLASIFGELARNYPELDGLHMDYVRYPSDTEARAFRVFSFDKPSVARFKQIYGKYPGYSSKEWQKFKRDQVTQSIRQIREAMKAESPTMELSGTFWAETAKALEQTGQDARQWLEEGIVDWVVPMSYKKNMDDLRMNLAELVNWFGEERKDQMVLGLNADFNTAWQVSQQIQEVLNQDWAGEALFAYSSLFKNHKANEKAEIVRQIWLDEQIKDLLVNTMNSK